MSLTLEQKRVALAYKVTESHADTPDRASKWRRSVMDFGTNVQRCGLLQALAFLRRDEAAIYTGLARELREHLTQQGFLDRTCDADLMTATRTLPSLTYMVVTREVLAVSLWLRRAAQILCREESAPRAEGEVPA